MDEWLVERDDGLIYHQLTNKPYSGPFFEVSDGKISSEGTLKKGKIDGIYNEYWYDENEEQNYIDSEYTFRNGVPILYKTFYYNGNISSIERFNNEGLEHGTWNEYFDDGSIYSERIYRDGTPVGPVKVFYENGQLQEYGVYKDGIKTGDWDEYSSDGEIIYKKSYDEYGLLSGKGPIKNGKEEGIWEGYHKGRLFSKGLYKNGKKEGLWERYYEGKLTSKGLYKNGYKDGIWEEYDGEGKLTSKGLYDKYGYRKEGIWKYYDENGILIETKTH